MAEEKPKVKDFFTNLDYAELLLAVRPKMHTEKQLAFVGATIENFNKYGGTAYLTEKQKEWLENARG